MEMCEKNKEKHCGRMKTGMNDEMMDMGFTATIGSGETYDLLLTADNKEPLYGRYIFNGQDDIPSMCEQMSDLQAIDPALIADIPTQPGLM